MKYPLTVQFDAQVLLFEMQDTQPGNGHIIKEKLILWQNLFYSVMAKNL